MDSERSWRAGWRTWLWGLGLVMCLGAQPAEGGDRAPPPGMTAEEANRQVQIAADKLQQAEALIPTRKLEQILPLVAEAQAIFERLGSEPGVGYARLVRGEALYCAAQFRPAAIELDAALAAFTDPNLAGIRGHALLYRGMAAIVLGDPNARRILDRALSDYTTVGDLVGQANARYGIGEVLSKLGRLEEARTFYEQALDGYTAAGFPQGQANARKSIGDVLRLKGSLEEASRFLEQALDGYTTIGDSQGQANARFSISDVLSQQGRLDEARTYYEQVLDAYTAVGDSQGRANVHLRICDVLRVQGHLENARSSCEQALDAYTDAGDRQGQANAGLGIGNVLYLQGHLDQARAHYEQVLNVYTAVGDSVGRANACLGIGDVLSKQGHQEEARSFYEQALDLNISVGTLTEQADARLRIGNVLSKQGRPDEARTFYEQALLGYTSVGNPLGRANARLSIGDVQYSQGHLEDALSSHEQALKDYISIGSLPGQANARLSIGDVLGQQGRLEEAATFYRQALKDYNSVGTLQGQANTRLAIGRVLRQQGRLEEAATFYRQALKDYTTVGDPQGQANSQLGQARALRDSEPENAWTSASEAFRLLRDEVQPQLGGRSSLLRYSEQFSSMVTDLVLLGIEMNHPEEALEAALLLQGRGLLYSRALAEAMAGLNATEQAKGQTLLQEHAQAQERTGHAMTALLVHADAGTLGALRTARRDLEVSEAALAQALNLGPTAFAPPTVKELQAALQADPSHPVLAVYYQRGSELMVFLLDGLTVKVVPLVGPRAAKIVPPGGYEAREVTLVSLGDSTVNLVKSLEAAGAARTAGDLTRALADFALPDAETLYQALVDPWDEVLACTPGPCRPLIIVPDGLTHWVPFDALAASAPPVTSKADAFNAITAADYLGKKTSIALLPTPGLLVDRFRVAHPPTGAAVLGSPTGSGFGPAEQQELQSATTAFAPYCKRGAPCPKGPLTGEQATAANLRSWWPQVRFLHTSSHGTAGWVTVPGLAQPYDEPVSLLLFAAPAPFIAMVSRAISSKSGSSMTKGIPLSTFATLAAALGTNAVVGPDELSTPGAAPEMVVLSSCSSARGDATKTEGFAGVTYAMLASGAGGVISAAWPVNVDATALQMDALYKAHFQQGQPWATALFTSRKALHGTTADGLPLDHPYFWAAFNLNGYEPALPSTP